LINSDSEFTLIVHKFILKASRFRQLIAIMEMWVASLWIRLQGCSEMKKLDFDKTLLEAVDGALLTFGESPKKAIYYHLDKSFKLQRKDIPEDIDKFSHALNTFFGPGSEVIGKLIVKNLYSKLNLNLEEKARFEIVDYISIAREIAKREQQRMKVAKRKRRNPLERK